MSKAALSTDFHYEEVDDREWDLKCKYGDEPIAALTARVRDIHDDPNDRLAHITSAELAGALRRIGPGRPLPPEVFSHVCDVLEGKAPMPRGRESYYRRRDFQEGYAKYQWLLTHLRKLKQQGQFSSWLEKNGMSHLSPSAAAAEYVASGYFPGVSGQALRNSFVELNHRKRREFDD